MLTGSFELHAAAAAARWRQLCGTKLPFDDMLGSCQNPPNAGTQSMKFRLARTSDASALAAISIEVWLGTYIKKGVSEFFADFALSKFTSTKLATLLEDPDEHVIVSEDADGIDGFIRISHNKTAPVAGCCSTMEISTLYVQPRHHGRGLGRALLEQALIYARGTDAPSV